MKAFIDNSLLRKISTYEAEKEKDILLNPEEENARNILLDAFANTDKVAGVQSIQPLFGWPSFLEYIDLGFLLKTFPSFDDQSKLFAFLISTLALDDQEDLIIRLYDQVFVECLTQVKALPQIDQTFLINQIQKKRRFSLFSPTKEIFAPLLDHYERLLIDNPYNTLHDLTLYLGWDRVCVNLAIVFDHPSKELKIQSGLEILKECLAESFQHITGQGRTAPGFFRLIETLYAYQMREENLETHTDSEWQILCQSSPALRPRDELSDISYIDAAVVSQLYQNAGPVRILTMDSAERVQAGLSLANYMIGKLKREIPGWSYFLAPVEVFCLKESDRSLSVDAILHS